MWVLPRLFKLWPWVDLDPFYTKVKFGHIGFCVGKSENYYLLITIAALGLKVAWSIQLNEFIKLSEYQRSRSFFDLGQRSLRFQSWNFFFLKNSWAIWNQSSYESLREHGNEIYTNELGHMTNMAAMLIYGKNLKKFSPEPIVWWPWNLIGSIVYVSTTKVVQIMTLGWPWSILHQGQIWSHRLLCGKKWKLLSFW